MELITITLLLNLGLVILIFILNIRVQQYRLCWQQPKVVRLIVLRMVVDFWESLPNNRDIWYSQNEFFLTQNNFLIVKQIEVKPASEPLSVWTVRFSNSVDSIGKNKVDSWLRNRKVVTRNWKIKLLAVF